MTEEKLFTQKELDEIVTKRLARQQKKHLETIRSIIKALTQGGGEVIGDEGKYTTGES